MKNYCALFIFTGIMLAGAAPVPALGPVRLPIFSAQVAGLNTSATSPRAEVPEKPGELSAGNAPKNTTSVNTPDATPTIARLDAGTLLVAELTKSLNAKKLQPGDKVTAKIIQPVIINGKVVLPRGAKLIGNVTETKARTKEDQESRLGMIFAKAMTKNGEELPLDAVIQALAPAQPSRVDRADPMLPPQIGPEMSNAPQPVGTTRTTSSGTLRGSPVTPPTPNVSTSLAPKVAAGTIPNPKEGLQENGILGAGSRGIFGFRGLTLRFTGGAQIPVISSVREDVKLESGTQMVLRVTGSGR